REQLAEPAESVRAQRLSRDIGVLRQGIYERHRCPRSEQPLAPERQQRCGPSLAFDHGDQRLRSAPLGKLRRGTDDLESLEHANAAGPRARLVPQRLQTRDGIEAGYDLEVVHGGEWRLQLGGLRRRKGGPTIRSRRLYCVKGAHGKSCATSAIGRTPSRGAMRAITRPAVGAALRPASTSPAAASVPLGSKMSTITRYLGSSIGNAATNDDTTDFS